MTHDAKSLEGRIEEWPDNICADRHEVTGEWVLHYLTDEQAMVCQAALNYHANQSVDMIEKVGRAMMETVFHEIDVSTTPMDWTGNDVWGCDFEEMAKAAILTMQAALASAPDEGEVTKEALATIRELEEKAEQERQINDSAMQTNKAMGERLKELEGKLEDAASQLEYMGQERPFLFSARQHYERTDMLPPHAGCAKVAREIRELLSRLSEKPKGE